MNLEVDEEWDDKSPLWDWELGVLKGMLQVSEILGKNQDFHNQVMPPSYTNNHLPLKILESGPAKT